MSIPKVSDEVLAQIDEHARSDVEREVGGILVGSIADGVATVTAALPALKAVGGSANVTFTHEVWDEVLNEIDEHHPGQSIVGWYHSHPGFGVFLSEYDLFIHRNFFTDEAMPALVIDPLRGEAGWFAGTGDDVVQVGAYEVEAMQAPAAAAAAVREERSRASTLALAAAAAVVAAFAIGWALAPDGVDASSSDAQLLADAEARNTALTAELDAARAQAQGAAAPSHLVYTVAAGDTLTGIAARFYRDANRWPEIRDANNLEGSTIEVGQRLVVPLTEPSDGQLSIEPAASKEKADG